MAPTASAFSAVTEIEAGWELAASPPGTWSHPADAVSGQWRPARVPGTAAAAVDFDATRDFDAEDWWFRVRFPRPSRAEDARLFLTLGGIATVSQVFLDGREILRSESMWRSHELDVTDLLCEESELVIACRALRPLLMARRRPAARWRTRVVNHGNLRWYRTMIFGRSPGFAPGPAAVGPWRPVRLTERRPGDVAGLRIRPSLDGREGVVDVRAWTVGPAGGPVHAVLGRHRVELQPCAHDTVSGKLLVPGAARWWPHTHGDPVRHELRIEIDGELRASRQTGFRSLTWASEIRVDGLDLQVNGVPVFGRGAVWTPADLVSLAPRPEVLRQLLVQVRDAGMNMLRVVGTGAYESPAFHDLCDELGIMVWQDLMFANLDYPLADPGFRAEVEAEAREVLDGLIGHPSLTVVCGNSEVEQQAAMLGLEPDLGREEFWDQRLPEILTELGADCPYVPSTPCGGVLPFHPAHGIAHYFGVSGYFRAPEDARRAEIRFAAECLAFANVPDEVEVPVHHPRWKAGVARDAGTGWDLGSGWDFDDVRDHYLRLLFGVDPLSLRRYDHDRYLELSRFASGEVMAQAIGEWRRSGSPCRGALVLWLKDMAPGAGLGVLDHNGRPKVALHYLSRAFAPVSVWSTDEGLAGVLAHVVNDRPQPLNATLRIALYRHLQEPVDEARREIHLPAHSAEAHNVEEILGRFVDAAWAYRFGPPTQDLIVLSLEMAGELGVQQLSQAFHFPSGPPLEQWTAAELGLTATVQARGGSAAALWVQSRRFTYGVRVHIPGFMAADDAFSLEPGAVREVAMHRYADDGAPSGTISALNLRGTVAVTPDGNAS